MTKEEKYSELHKRIKGIIEGESDPVSNMANAAALIHEAFGFWWTGFYIIRGSELVLGPFQGPAACTRIPFGKGVCGTAWARQESIIVPDVEEFPGHIACSSLSRSEIVVPVLEDGEIKAVLDIDSKDLATFNETDQQWLERITALIKLT